MQALGNPTVDYFSLVIEGGEFGVSSNLRTLCAIGGAGKRNPFFDFNWREQLWNLIFIIGASVGGFLASTLLTSPEPVQIAQSTQVHLQSLGIHTPQSLDEGLGFLPLAPDGLALP